MQILVKLSWPIWKTVGARSVSVSLDGAATVADVLARLAAEHSSFEHELTTGAGNGAVQYALFLNATRVRREDAGRTLVQDGDELYVILPMVGGNS
jgi:molybdopterin converting factor small subunit